MHTFIEIITCELSIQSDVVVYVMSVLLTALVRRSLHSGEVWG